MDRLVFNKAWMMPSSNSSMMPRSFKSAVLSRQASYPQHRVIPQSWPFKTTLSYYKHLLFMIWTDSPSSACLPRLLRQFFQVQHPKEHGKNQIYRNVWRTIYVSNSKFVLNRIMNKLKLHVLQLPQFSSEVMEVSAPVLRIRLKIFSEARVSIYHDYNYMNF